MKIPHLLAAATLLAVSAPVLAKDLLSKDQYIDYQAQMKCAEQQYSYNDPDMYEKEQAKIDKAFKVTEKDIENGRMDDLMGKYGSDNAVLDAIDARVNSLCPTPQ